MKIVETPRQQNGPENKMKKMPSRFLRLSLLTFILAVLVSPLSAMRFPDVFYFPFTPGFSFSLVSEKSNTMDVVANIVIPDDEDLEIFYLDWNIRLNIDKRDLVYSLRFVVMTNGDVYLSEMKDESYLRYFEPKPLIFPQSLKLNTVISVGENMSLKYIKKIPALRVGDRSFNNVIVAELTMSDEVISLYFAEKSGIVGMKTRRETFRKK